MFETQTPEILAGGSSVLIAGGSGLVGSYLTSALLSEGYTVSHLSRNAGTSGRVKVLRWNPGQNIIDPEALDGVDYIINLAGANLGDGRWTIHRKEEIISSRVDSARLLHKEIIKKGIKLKAFITASASGYYGAITAEKIFSETDAPGYDFLGTACRLWEEGADLFTDIAGRTVKIRTAVVLEKSGGALSRLMNPASIGFVVRLGNGKQYFPWIHMYDLCNIYLKALKDEHMSGAYNAVAPEHINHDDFVKTMAEVMDKPVFLPRVPGWILRSVIGEMSDIVLKGSRLSSEKIIKAGYNFRFEKLDEALKNIIRD